MSKKTKKLATRGKERGQVRKSATTGKKTRTQTSGQNKERALEAKGRRGATVTSIAATENNASDSTSPVKQTDARIGDAQATRLRPAAPARSRIAANDDRPSIGGLIYALQAKPSKSPFLIAAMASIVWLFIGSIFGWSIVSNAMGGNVTFAQVMETPTVFIVVAAILVPIAIFWFLAQLTWRSQDLKLVASAMTEVAIRLAEPDKMAEQRVASVGQTIRRQVTAMNDSISRALGRAGELEALVHNEVAALERSYSENEHIIRNLIAELASEREAIANNSIRVRDSLQGIGTQVARDLEETTGQVTKNIQSATHNIAGSLAKKGETITSAVTAAGTAIDQKLNERGTQITEQLVSQGNRTTNQLQRVGKEITTALQQTSEQTANLVSSKGNAVVTELSQMNTRIAKEIPSLLSRLSAEQVKLNDVVRGAGKNLAALETALVERTGSLENSLVARTQHLDSVLKQHTHTFGSSLAEKVKALDASLTQRARMMESTLSEKAKAIDTSMAQRSKALDESLAKRAESIDNSLNSQTKALDKSLAEKARALDAALAQKTKALDTAMEQKTKILDKSLAHRAEVMDKSLHDRAHSLETSLSDKARALDVALGQRLHDMDSSLENKAKEMNASLSGHVETINVSLAEKAVALDTALAQKARFLDESLMQKAQAIDGSLSKRLAAIDSSLTEHSGAIETSLVRQTENMHRTLSQHSSAIENSLTAQTEALDKTLSLGSAALRETTDRIANQSTDSSMAMVQQTKMLKEVSDALLNQIGTLTQRFETQGQSILSAARMLDTSNTRIDEILGSRHHAVKDLLVEVSGKAEELDQTMKTYTSAMQNSLAEAEKRATALKQSLAQDTSLTSQYAMAEIDKLRANAKQQTERAVSEIKQSFGNITQEVAQHVSKIAAMRDQMATIPEETRKNTGTMRKAIQDQLRALETLSSIANKHGTGTDVQLPAAAQHGITHVPQRDSAFTRITNPSESMDQNGIASNGSLSNGHSARTAGARAKSGALLSNQPTQRTSQTSDMSSHHVAPSAGPLSPLTGSTSAPTTSKGVGAGLGINTQRTDVDRSKWSFGDLLARMEEAEDDPFDEARPNYLPAKSSQGSDASPSHNLLDLLQVNNITRAIDKDTANRAWLRYQRGERDVFQRQMYSPEGQMTFDQIKGKYNLDVEFRDTVDRYVQDFENLLQQAGNRDPQGTLAQNYLTSETGLVYLMLAHASGRLGRG